MITIYFRHIRSEKLSQLTSPKAGSWLNVVNPSNTELDELAEHYHLDRSLLQDGLDPNESPRVEIEDGATYIYTRFCYSDDGRILTAPLLIVYGEQQLLTVAGRKFQRLANLMDGRTPVVTTQKTKLLLQILSEVRQSYATQLNVISKTILTIRSGLKKEQIDNQDFVTFIDIEDTLNDFLSGLVPTSSILRSLMSGRYFKLYEEDEDLIEDLSLGITELIELTKSRLTTIVNIREAYSTIMANNLNKIFKRLTSITIMMTVPMIISSIYGMNVVLPFMHSPWAFAEVMSLTAVAMLVTYTIFRRNRWF
ncbi:MAG TPA: magnesium transporter CorA family protein [Candidatus Saccharimonadia bacterium]